MQSHKSTITNLKKAKTSLEKIIQMIEDESYCIDIIQQNLAVIGLLKSANLQLLESHLSNCFIDAIKSGDQTTQNEIIQEVLTVVKTAQNK